MATQAFIDSVIKEIIQPGVDELVGLPYFTELRAGTLSKKRLQGWALQHYLHNHALLKGFALCMVKNSHEPELFKYFLYQMNEEQYHPDLAKKFGLESACKKKTFRKRRRSSSASRTRAKPFTACCLGSAPENRASALVNETMVCRYSEEHIAALKKHYGLNDKQIQFFTVHAIADQEHTAMAAEVIAKHTNTEHQQQLVREAAAHMVRFKIAKFQGIYNAYA